MRERGTAAGDEEQNTEITLGMGKLLGLFFALVILCGISLGVGYSLGRTSARKATEAAALATPTPPADSAPSAANKPGASQAAAPVAPPGGPDCAAANNGQPPAAAAPDTTDLTFYQSVKQKDEHPQLTPPEPAPKPATLPTEPKLGAGYLVQIAAVRYEDVANLLREALQKQHYPVIVSQPGDNLFHVQVGPYADVKEAGDIRDRLVKAGYNAFLKR